MLVKISEKACLDHTGIGWGATKALHLGRKKVHFCLKPFWISAALCAFAFMPGANTQQWGSWSGFDIFQSSVGWSEETAIHHHRTYLSLGYVPMFWMETCPTTHIGDFIPQCCMKQQRGITSPGDKAHGAAVAACNAVQLRGLFQQDVKEHKVAGYMLWAAEVPPAFTPSCELFDSKNSLGPLSEKWG